MLSSSGWAWTSRSVRLASGTGQLLVGRLVVELRDQRVEVEGARVHLQLAVRLAGILRRIPIGVQLDAVAVGIVKIECLGNAVIGRAIEMHVVVDQPAKRSRQLP